MTKSMRSQIVKDYFEYVKDLLASPQILQMREYPQHGNTSCFKHCKDVSFISLKLVRKWGIKCNERSLVRGALLHDYFLYDWHEKKIIELHGFTHPKIALQNAERDFTLNKIECEIIKKHMWPLSIIPPTRKEAWIVCLVDKYCSISEVIRAICREDKIMKPVKIDKSLSEMTLEELWELFPIVLSEHKEYWGDWYEEEKRNITAMLHDENLKISHIGSTAMNHIWSKPIIDILIEIPKSISMADIKAKLVDNGYLCMSEEENRKSFNKGYTNKGFAERVFHLHLRYYGDHDELYFRDYMNNNPVLRAEYEKLKRSLWKKYEHNRDAYTDAKSAFVEKYTKCAKAEYENRYERVRGDD